MVVALVAGQLLLASKRKVPHEALQAEMEVKRMIFDMKSVSGYLRDIKSIKLVPFDFLRTPVLKSRWHVQIQRPGEGGVPASNRQNYLSNAENDAHTRTR
jgi:hypothetical protein